MDMRRIQEIQNPSIMSYHQQRIVWGENPINCISNIPERINIQPRINFIQNSQVCPQNRKLQDFIALALTPTKPFVHIPIEKVRLHVNKLKFLHQFNYYNTSSGPSSGHNEKLIIGNTGDFNRGLETHKETRKRPFFRFHLKQIFPFEHNSTSGYFIIRRVGKESNLGESAFARTIFTHDGVNLSLVDGKVNAVENLHVGFHYLSPQVIHFE
ncbi:hypothetical protein CR513_45164, partial [Mucuna pruriens]